MSQFDSTQIPSTDQGNDQFSRFQVEQIYKPAVQDSILYMLADKMPMSGKSIAIPSYEFLTQVEDEASELDDYQEAVLSMSGKEVDAIDCGLTLVLTRQAVEEAKSELQLLQSNQEALKEHLTRSLDNKCADALRGALVKGVFSSSTAVTYVTNGTPVATAASDLNIYLAQKLGTDAKQRWNMKPRANGKYAVVVNYNAALSVLNDSSTKNVLQGQGLGALGVFLIGSVGLVDIMCSNQTGAVASSIGAGPVAYSEGYLLGAKSHFVGILRAPEIVFQDDRKNKVTEFGKFKYMHYDFAAAFGLPTDSVNKDLVPAIHLTSA